MSKIVNITSKEDKDQKLQDNADSRKMDTLTEALDALEDAYEAVSDVLLEEL